VEFVLHLFEPPPPAHPLSNSSVFIVFFVSGGTLLSLRGGLGKIGGDPAVLIIEVFCRYPALRAATALSRAPTLPFKKVMR
jgi:hypothetical protein